MKNLTNTNYKSWEERVLLLAGIYNILFGAICVLKPALLFNLISMDLPKYLFLWQCIGMIVGVYGIGYIIASKNPTRHWPITLVGLLGKVFGPIGFIDTAIKGSIKWEFGYVIFFNDLIWLIPFFFNTYQCL